MQILVALPAYCASHAHSLCFFTYRPFAVRCLWYSSISHEDFSAVFPKAPLPTRPPGPRGKVPGGANEVALSPSDRLPSREAQAEKQHPICTSDQAHVLCGLTRFLIIRQPTKPTGGCRSTKCMEYSILLLTRSSISHLARS